MILCGICKIPFTPQSVTARYCSSSCLNLSRHRRGRPARSNASGLRLAAIPVPAAARPTELLGCLTPEGVDEHRRIWCVYYDQCLAVAEAYFWRSFSCRSCDVREETPIAERKAEAAIWAVRAK